MNLRDRVRAHYEMLPPHAKERQSVILLHECLQYITDAEDVLRWAWLTLHAPAKLHDRAARLLDEPSLASGCGSEEGP